MRVNMHNCMYEPNKLELGREEKGETCFSRISEMNFASLKNMEGKIFSTLLAQYKAVVCIKKKKVHRVL